MRSPDQAATGKVSQGNLTVIPAFESTMYPSLGDFYNLQFRAIQAARKIRETNVGLLKEATRM